MDIFAKLAFCADVFLNKSSYIRWKHISNFSVTYRLWVENQQSWHDQTQLSSYSRSPTCHRQLSPPKTAETHPFEQNAPNYKWIVMGSHMP
eukprot:1982955-Amphidinium_carterae.1